jgi:hypothetical protein
VEAALAAEREAVGRTRRIPMVNQRCKNCGQLFDPEQNPKTFGFGTQTFGFQCSFHPSDPAIAHDAPTTGARDGYFDFWRFPCCGKLVPGGEFDGKSLRPARAPGCKNGPHEPDPEWELRARSAETDYDYDVALSFAGEDRPYVQEVARILNELGVRVFYDRYETADLWGKDLYTHLDDIYGKKSRYCAMFISRYYKEKVWTSHERAAAQARALVSGGEYVLPVRFDDTEIPGIRATTAYLDLRRLTSDELARAILSKLGIQTEVDQMINYLVTHLPGYVITIQGTDLRFRSDREGFEADYPVRLMLEMFRANQLERMFILPAIVPW